MTGREQIRTVGCCRIAATYSHMRGPQTLHRGQFSLVGGRGKVEGSQEKKKTFLKETYAASTFLPSSPRVASRNTDMGEGSTMASEWASLNDS